LQRADAIPKVAPPVASDELMLAYLRTLTKGPVAITLVLLMAVAFAIWGMPNMFSAANRAPARVNGEAVSRADLERLVDSFVRRAQQEDPTFTRDQAIEQGVAGFALQRLITERAIHQFVRSLGVSASDGQLAEAIRSMPQFQAALDPTGAGGFDPIAYRSAVGEMGFGVPEFEAMLRSEIASVQVFTALSLGTRAPQSFAAFDLAYQSESRELSFVEVPPVSPETMPAPSEEELSAFYAERSSAWQRPERRTLMIAVADPSAFADRVQVSEEQLRAEFDRVSSTWAQPERRTFVQITLPSEAAAQDAAARLTGGAEPAEVAAALGGQVITHDNVAREDLADPQIAEAAFGIALGGPAEAAQGSLAPWSAIRLSSVTAAVTASFEERRDEVRQSIVLEEAVTLMQDAVREFEQQRRRRVAFEEAAAATGLRAVRVENIAADGSLADGSQGITFPGAADILQAAFEARQGRASDWLNLETGEEVSVLVESITAASIPELAEVADEVRMAWRANQAGNRQRATAQAVVEAVTGGETLAAAAQARGLRMINSPEGLSRQQVNQTFGPEVLGQAFGLGVGEAGFGRLAVTGPDGRPQATPVLMVVGVRSISRMSPEEAGPILEQLRLQGTQQLQQTMGDTLTAAARGRARVEEDEEVVQQMFPTSPDAGA
jgi:peptidyl-prolyl cis-trans isomerase D